MVGAHIFVIALIYVVLIYSQRLVSRDYLLCESSRVRLSTVPIFY